MRDFYSKYKRYIILFLVIFGIVILPVLVNCLFKLYSLVPLFVDEWSAGEFLGFYGSLLGAAATIIAIVLTINFTTSNQKEERRLSQKPYLHSSYSPLYELPDQDLTNDILYVTINKEQIYSYKKPPYSFFQSYKKTGDKINDILTSLHFTKHNHIIQYNLSNVGAGNALNIDFTINSEMFIPQFALPINNTKKLIFLCNEDILTNDEYRLKFEFSYWDVSSTAKYQQTEIIKLYRFEHDGSLSTTQQVDWLLSKPDWINKLKKVDRKI